MNGVLKLTVYIQITLRQCNSYVHDFVQICELNESELLNASIIINPQAKPRHEHRRVHNLNLKELAVLSNEKASSNDIVIRRRGGGLSEVADTHRSYDPLHFTLLFPLGTDGWNLNMKLRHAEFFMIFQLSEVSKFQLCFLVTPIKR